MLKTWLHKARAACSSWISFMQGVGLNDRHSFLPVFFFYDSGSFSMIFWELTTNNALATTNTQSTKISNKFPIKTFTVNCKVNYNVLLIKILQEKSGYNYVKSFSIISLLGREKAKKKKNHLEGLANTWLNKTDSIMFNISCWGLPVAPNRSFHGSMIL